MADLSLRQYHKLIADSSGQGVRSCCAPSLRTKTISLRSIMTALRIIHISDPHFCDASWYLNTGGTLGVKQQYQDSAKRSNVLANFIIQNQSLFGTNKVILTGDLTDSGDTGDYEIARDFIQNKLTNNFEVYSNPGNHDYCKMGTIVVNTVINDGMKVIFCPVCRYNGITPPPYGTGYFCCLHTLAGHAAPPHATCPIDVVLRDDASNLERRQRFITYITGYSQYPHVVDFDNGRLILLDSMQAELDENTSDKGAEGKLGDLQLYGTPGSTPGLSQYVDEYQDKRKAGKKLIISLHHSPYKITDDGTKELRDADKFFDIVNNKIDCLLFGHTTPDNVYQQPNSKNNPSDDKAINDNEKEIPLINCENLQNVSDNGSYPITVIDSGTMQRIVFYTDGTTPPERSFPLV